MEIVVPVYNEAEQLARSITALRTYLDTSFPFVATITIADNASTDRTWPIATELASTMDGVGAVHLDQKGRGRALRAAWSKSTASVVAYMDVDLATGLDALLPLVAPLLSGHSDVAIGTRLGPGSHVVRGARREMISRAYNLLLRSALRSPCTDAQCGFKALRRDAAAEVLPLVEDDEWFFDTEVLVTAQRVGLRIHEVPVDWVDDTDSRVDVLHTALDDLRGVWRMLGRRPAPDGALHLRPSMRASLSELVVIDCDHRVRVDRQGSRRQAEPDCRRHDRPAATGAPGDTEIFADELLRSAGVGAVSTVAHAAAFAALEPSLGGYLANAVAIIGCSMGNTAAHRGMAGSPGIGLDRSRRMGTAPALTGVSLVFTTGALAVTRALGLRSLVPELCAVTVGNAGAAVVRFAILRNWVFRPQFGTHLATGSGPSARAPPGRFPRRRGGRRDRHATRQRRHHRRTDGGHDRSDHRASRCRRSTSHPAPYGWAPDRPVEEAGAGGPGNGAPATDPPTPAPPPGRLSRLVRGRPQDPAWVRPALVVLLVGTGFLYIWGLGRSGWANSFYSAAVQAGTKSWKAFFFGSFDASNFITVDKPPASLWVMEISARLFGVNCVEHPRAPGPGGRGHRRAPLRHRSPLVLTRGGPAGRGRPGPHPGGHADVPVQQSRRHAHARADRSGVRHRPGPRERAGPGGWCSPGRSSGSASSPRCSRP